MIINGTQKVQVNIDDPTARQVAISVLRIMFDLPEGHYVQWETGELMHAEDVQYGAHSSMKYELVRKATDNDMAAYRMIRQLEKGKVDE